MNTDIGGDVFDMRDVTDRFEELEANEERNEDENEELAALQALLDDTCGKGGDHQWRGDWYPRSMIAESYFEEAMDEMLEDIGDLPKNLPCYLKITVDYDALKMDYTSTEFDGVTYWSR